VHGLPSLTCEGDITAPKAIRDAMDKQAEAERRKRAMILDSEGRQFSEINIAEGQKQAQILESQAEYQSRVNIAKGVRCASVIQPHLSNRKLKLSDSQQKPLRRVMASLL